MAAPRSSRSPPPPLPARSPAPPSAYEPPPCPNPSYADTAGGAALCSGVVTDVEPFEERAGDAVVRGVLHRPGAPTGDGAVLAHGAGSNCAPPVFVHGTRDPFGSVDELQAARGLVPAPTRLLAVSGAGHDLGARADAAFADVAAVEILALLG